jgi:hypothetical protein
MARHLRSLALLAPVGVSLAGMASCSAPSKGALMVAITTDMETPKDFSVVSVFVESDSAVKFDYVGRVLPDGSVALPATVAIVEPDDPNAQIHIRVTAFQERNARVLRDVLTTIPHGRTTLLRMPLSALDDGSVTGTLPLPNLPSNPNDPASGGMASEGNSDFLPTDPTVLTTKCDFLDKRETMINGQCQPAAVPTSQLVDYQETAVYGSGGMRSSGLPAKCFDVATCFAGATEVPPPSMSMTGCSFPLPQGADVTKYNLALATTDGTGVCTASGQCFVPLTNDPTGPTGDGWFVNGGNIEMITGICMKMLGAGAKLYQVQGSCPAKTLSDPVCEPTTLAEVMALRDAGAPSDAGGGLGDGGTAPDASQDATASDSSAGCPKGQILCNGVCFAGSICGQGNDAGSDVTVTDAGSDAAAGRDASAGCASSAQCGGGAPICNTATGACVQCLTMTDCSGGNVCNTSNVCVPPAGSDAAGG